MKEWSESMGDTPTEGTIGSCEYEKNGPGCELCVRVRDPVERGTRYLYLNHNRWHEYWLVAVAVDQTKHRIDCAMYVRDPEHEDGWRWRERMDQWIRLQFPAKLDDDLSRLWFRIIESKWIDPVDGFERFGDSEYDDLRSYSAADIKYARLVDQQASLEDIEGEIAELKLKYRHHVVTGKIYNPIPGLGKSKAIKDFPELFERITHGTTLRR